MVRTRSLLTSGNFFPNWCYWTVLLEDFQKEQPSDVSDRRVPFQLSPSGSTCPSSMDSWWCPGQTQGFQAWTDSVSHLLSDSALHLLSGFEQMASSCCASSAVMRSEANRVCFGLFQIVRSLNCFMHFWAYLARWSFNFHCGLYLGHRNLQIFCNSSRIL